jgi:triosephosphate isomerase (TIM)
MARTIIVGNWKSYVTSFALAKKLFKEIELHLPKKTSADIVVCPPHLFIDYLADSYQGTRISFGAQDAHFETGAATGTVSAPALKSIGVTHVICGHTERRAMGETDDIVSKKIGAVLDEKMIPIVCLGETKRDREGNYLEELEATIKGSLARIQEKDMKKIILAYEPVWAIGAPLAPDARIVRETIIFIRKVLADLFDREVALKTRIIYGGAVDTDTAEDLLANSGAHGFLLGRASVDAERFTKIIALSH